MTSHQLKITFDYSLKATPVTFTVVDLIYQVVNLITLSSHCCIEPFYVDFF